LVMGLRTFLKSIITESGDLEIEDIQVGDGEEALPGKTVVVHYVGTLSDGSVFDSSRSRAQPFEFVLGAGKVIAGWDQGVEGMKVGGKRKLTVPARLGYGRRGAPPTIPGGATLIFEVELIRVRKARRSSAPC
jgi:FKBP-type peptidyl-prolyl cis-trans isomerase FkpA